MSVTLNSLRYYHKRIKHSGCRDYDSVTGMLHDTGLSGIDVISNCKRIFEKRCGALSQ